MNGDYIVYALTTLNLCACMVYMFSGDYARTVYWFAAFLLTGSTVFIGR